MKNKKYILIIIISTFIVYLLFLFFREEPTINDSKYRNNKWAWCIDENTKKGKWFKIAKTSNFQNGSYTAFFKNGNIFEKGKMKNFKLIDTIYSYGIENEIIKYTIINTDTINYYLNNGTYKEYFQNGMIRAKGEVENHKIGINWKTYYPSGILNTHNYKYQNDTINLKYYENGKIRDSLVLKNGIKILKRHIWHPNGLLHEITNYKNGVLNGKFEQWHSNGNISVKGNFTLNKKEGTFIKYFENGNKKFFVNYINDTVNGKSIEYNDSGKIINKYTFFNGKFIVD